MISVNELRRGKVIKVDGDLFACIEYEHHKPGKGKAYVRTKMRNLNKGSIVDMTFNSDDKVDDVFVEKRTAQYLYKDGESYIFMDSESYEQNPVSAEELGDAVNYLKEEMDVEIDVYEGAIIGVELPNHVVLEVTYTEPGLKGDTSGTARKSAEVETGLTVNVPLFINNGDKLKIDTRTGEYIERM